MLAECLELVVKKALTNEYAQDEALQQRQEESGKTEAWKQEEELLIELYKKVLCSQDLIKT